jgi:hypothetical protein
MEFHFVPVGQRKITRLDVGNVFMRGQAIKSIRLSMTKRDTKREEVRLST